MRLVLATIALLGIVLIGYASSGTAAQGQNLQAGISSGERLRLSFDANPIRPGYDCTVIEVRGDFVGCQAASPGTGQSPVESWYNLRLVARIDRPAKQE